VISEYIPPLLTQNPQKTVKENAEETESTPEMIPSSCRAQVLNLNDARLKAYATELAIMNRNNFSHRLTRAEFLSIAFRSANIQLPPETIATTSTGESSYSGASLETESVFYRSITYAIALGIISGNAEDFRPNDPISRGEATKILVNTFHFSPVSPDNIFADVPRGNTLAPYIESAHENCIIHGKNTLNGELIKGNYYLLFAPKDTITL